MKKLILSILTGFILISCQIQTTNPPGPAPVPTVTVPPTPPAPPSPPAPPTPPSPTACEKAEARMKELCLADAVANQYCCAVVTVTKKGKSFSQICEEEQAKAVFINPECLASITTCDDINYCTKSE